MLEEIFQHLSSLRIQREAISRRDNLVEVAVSSRDVIAPKGLLLKLLIFNKLPEKSIRFCFRIVSAHIRDLSMFGLLDQGHSYIDWQN